MNKFLKDISRIDFEIGCYVALVFSALCVRLVTFSIMDDPCHGTFSNPYTRICADFNWWFFVFVIFDLAIPILILKLPQIRNLPFSIRVLLVVAYALYIFLSPAIFRLPFWQEIVAAP